MSPPAEHATLDEIPLEGQRIVAAAQAARIPLVLVGGVAVWVRCPSARVPPLARTYGDVDLVGHTSDRREITTLMEGLGYTPDKMFNALHGASRLNFTDEVRDRPVDVLLDHFRMAHDLDLRQRVSPDATTLPLADLLLTKLQVVSLNEKDLRDLVALLLDHGWDGEDPIDRSRILDVAAADWGFEHTIHRTLDTIRADLGALDLPPEQHAVVRARADELDAALHAAPKSRRWKLRARVGERVRWYEEPEEAR